MRVCFHYTTPDGALFALPLEVDERRPFAHIIEDAHEIAREVAEGCTFRTVVLPHQERGLRSIAEVVDPIVARAMDELKRIGSIEGPLRG